MEAKQIQSGEKRYFLDVRQSARGMAWEHRLDQRGENIALAMAQSYGLPDIVARILAGRGVGQEDARRFLNPSIRDLLPDPLTLTDMDKAGERIVQAIMRRERVAVFGDYDVDGAVSSALLKIFLRHFGVEVEVYIPDRIFEGYGPNPDAMRELAGRGAKLIITADCGTNSAVAIAAARDSGADVVVLDHHQVGGALPDVPVVNPNRDDDLSGQGHLCAAGVVFLTLVEVARLLRRHMPGAAQPDLLSMLDLVALATVCDVVPLVGVNRAFVVKGLLVARQLQRPGLAALVRVSRIGEPLNSYHLGFMLGPRINAGGRIGNAALGSTLLASLVPDEAESIAATLDRLNQERQAMETEMLVQARAEVDTELVAGDGPAVLVTANDKWHPGIVGLIAARLKEYARRPAFAISFDANNIGTGSGRSIPGFDLGRLVRAAVEEGLLVKGGGHAMAAGITVERSKLGALRGFFEEKATSDIVNLRSSESLKIDAALSADGATFSLLDALEAAGPYGAGHAAPMLALPRHRLADARVVGNGHIRAELRSMTGARLQAMAFRAADNDLGQFLLGNRGAEIHVAGGLASNLWNGTKSMQFRITDAAKSL